MKVGRIDHQRCSEVQGYTLVAIPDDWSVIQFEAAVFHAQIIYESARAEFAAQQEPAPRSPFHRESWRDFPDDMTIGEAKRQKDEADELYRAWSERRRQMEEGLAHFLAAEGLTLLRESEPEYALTLDWGHAHGIKLEWNEDAGW